MFKRLSRELLFGVDTQIIISLFLSALMLGSSVVVMGIFATETAQAGDGVSDIQWSSSEPAKVFDVYHSESYSVQNEVSLTSTNSGTYQILADVYLTDDPFRGYVTGVDRIEFSVKWEQVNAEESQDDHFEVALEVGLTQAFQYLSWGTPPWRDWNSWSGGWSYDRVYADDDECPSCGIIVKAKGVNLESGFFNNDETIMSDPSWNVIMEQEKIKKSYQFSLSSHQVESVDGSVAISYYVSDKEGATASNPVQIYLNGHKIDQTSSTGSHTVSVDPSYLQTENTITVSVPASGDSSGPNNYPSYAYTVENIDVSANTDGNFDDDGWDNWNDPTEDDPNTDNEWKNDGVGGETKTDPDGDGTQNYADANNDGDSWTDGDDPSPQTANTDGTWKLDGKSGEGTGDTDSDGTQNYEDTDNDGDNVDDGNDPCPEDANCDGDNWNDKEDPTPKNANTDGAWRKDGASGESEADVDSDGTQNYKDGNNDGDGWADGNDPTPNTANSDQTWRKDGKSGEGQTDVDGDNTGNYADADNDGDSFDDDAEATAGTDPNDSADKPTKDDDKDGIPNSDDPCTTDPNCDDDGWNDGDDPTIETANTDGTWNLDGKSGETKSDADGDGTANYADSDNDGDSLSDGTEATTHTTDPLSADTDQDGYDDGTEATKGTSPTDASDYPSVSGNNSNPSATLSATKTSVSLGETVTLDASSSTDSDGDTLTYTWTVVSAPTGASVSTPTGENGAVTLDSAGTYTFQVKVSDGAKTDTATVTITATATDSGSDSVTVSQSLSSQSVSPGGTVKVTTKTTISKAIDRLAITGTVSPAVSNIQIANVNVDGEGKVLFQRANSRTLDVVLESLGAGTTVTVTYTVTVPANTSLGSTFTIQSGAQTPNTRINASSSTLTVQKGLGKFAGSDRVLSTNELRAVIKAWVFGDVKTSLLRDAITAWVMKQPV